MTCMYPHKALNYIYDIISHYIIEYNIIHHIYIYLIYHIDCFINLYILNVC